MRDSPSAFSIVVTASLLIYLSACSLPASQAREGEDLATGDLAGQCGSGHDLQIRNSEEAMNASLLFFECGRQTLPVLVGFLSNPNDYWGDCGAHQLESELTVVDFETGKALAFPNEPSNSRARLVGEAALYLIEAIIRDDLFFARSCTLRISGSESRNSAEVLHHLEKLRSLLGDLQESELIELSIDDLGQLMERVQLSFPPPTED